jgi:hypothetical protein
VADQKEITLYEGDATPKDIILRALPVAAVSAGTTIYLIEGATPSSDIILRDPTVQPSGSSFPTQYEFLRVRKTGSTITLCVVATADAPTGMGGQVRIRKGGVTYAVYLVETSDADASPVRIKTATGIKSVRLKT